MEERERDRIWEEKNFVKTLESSGGIDWANSRFMGREREKDC